MLRALALLLLLTLPARAQTIALAEPRRAGAIADEAVHESSGLAASRRAAGALWTHNDSGDEPRLFLLAADGAALGTWPVEAEADDWEDMASFEHDGHAWLLVADTGDNKGKRAHATLYLIAEPAAGAEPARLRPARALQVTYPGGAVDSEGVAVDVQAGLVLLVSKVRRGDGKPVVFSVPLAALLGAAPARAVEATAVATIDVPQLTTALDVSPDGRALVVLTYGDAYGWARGAREPWDQALARPATRLTLPRREQGETLCFTTDGRSLVIGSEGERSPLWVIPVEVR